MSTFALDIAKFAKKTKSTLDEAARAIKINLFTRVIRDTRVDTGRLRGNWQTTVGAPAAGQLERFDKVPQHARGGAAEDDAASVPRGDTIDYLTNNLPYAVVWEERDGMIAKNVADIQRIVKEATRDVGR